MAYHRYHGARRAHRAHLQHLRPAHARPTTAGWCRTSSCRRCEGKPITIYGDGSQTRSFCYVDDEVRGFLALLDSDVIGPGQHRQPRRVHHARAGRARARGHRLVVGDRATSRCRSTTPRSAGPTSPSPDRAPRLGAEDPAARGPRPHRRVLPRRRSASERTLSRSVASRASASARWSRYQSTVRAQAVVERGGGLEAERALGPARRRRARRGWPSGLVVSHRTSPS